MRAPYKTIVAEFPGDAAFEKPLTRGDAQQMSARLLPESIRLEIDRYATQGAEPGPMVRALLENNLAGAYQGPTVEDAGHLLLALLYIWQNVPKIAWGSALRVDHWIAWYAELRRWRDERIAFHRRRA